MKGLVELISLYKCIDDSQSFYIKEDGTTAQKKDGEFITVITTGSFASANTEYDI